MLAERLRRFSIVAMLCLLLAACGGGEDDAPAAGEGAGSATGADEADPGGGGEGVGPIEIWYSNNAAEITWGEAVVEAWNAEHPDQQVTAQEIPAGDSSEEVIQASIAAGNTPCLIYNTSPAAVPLFQRQQGLVALDEFEDGAEYVEQRTGEGVEQYQSDDGHYYQLPWKQNPVMIFYNTAMFEEAGMDTENAPLSTHEEFLETARTLVESGVAEAAIWPSPASQFFQPWFDFYPLFAAQTGGTQLVEDGEAQFAGEDGVTVAQFWRTMYDEGLAPREEAQGDAFAEERSAMAIVGPWAIGVYGDLDWAAAPVPTADGIPAEETYTFSDAKSVGMYVSCENRATAWEFLKFSTNEENDRLLLTETGQMPMRADLTEVYPDYFEENPAYEQFAAQAARTVEVPSVPNSVDMWQTFRDAYSESVIFGVPVVAPTLESAAEEVNSLVSEG
jgi:multiple sugar transport system substrate-binding protein